MMKRPTLVGALALGVLAVIAAAPFLATLTAQPGVSWTSQTFTVGAASEYRLIWPDQRAAGVLQSDALGAMSLGGISGALITSGTVAPARLGTGTPSDMVFLRGDGTWQTATGGGGGVTSLTATSPLSVDTGTGAVTISVSLTEADIPNLNASKINAGTLSAARIPVLGTANVGGLDASDTTTGEFGQNRIPNLPASKITSGSFPLGVIPDIPPSKIDEGTASNGQVLMVVSGVPTFTFPFEFPTTVSGREIAAPGSDRLVTTSTINRPTTSTSVSISATATVSITGPGTCSLYVLEWFPSSLVTLLGQMNAPDGVSVTLTATDATASATAVGSAAPFSLYVRSNNAQTTCTVAAGASLTLTTS